MKDHPSGLGESFSTLPFTDLAGYVAHAFSICEGHDVYGKWISRNAMADNFLPMSWQKKNGVPGYQLQLRI